MTYTAPPFVPVPAIPPRPPQLTLIGSSINPSNASDNPTGDRSADAIGRLSAQMKAELSDRDAEAWVRGFTYAPENHYAVETRDPYDFTSIDLPAIPAPSGVIAAPSVSGGTLTSGAKKYAITAVNANGETTISTPVTPTTTGSAGSVVLTWNQVQDGDTYHVYGRTTGSFGLLASVGPFDPDHLPTYTDTGAATVGAAAPGSNTTGGVGPYTNLPVVQVQPWLIVAEDFCSSFGFDARDFKGRAMRLLENATPQAVEREFWTGALAQAKGWPNNYLTSSSAVDLTPGAGPPSVGRGQQILQDYLSNTGFGGQGMLHCQPQTTPNLLNARRVGNLLLDVFDNIIVPGTGYSGTASGIGTPAAGTAVMFATDLVATRVEDTGRVDLLDPSGNVYPDSFAEALDRGQAGFPNTIRFRAMKFGAAYWDGAVQAGIRVTLAA